MMISDEEFAEKLQMQHVLGASYESSQGFCGICNKKKGADRMFKLQICSRHSFCSHCIGLYAQSKIRDNVFPITCPGLRCRVVIQPESCRSIIPVNTFARWEEGSAESAIPNGEKFYCPYKRCSGLFIHDRHEEIVQCICPLCKKLFCAKCRVPWHTGRDCDKFQKVEKDREDELKLKLLAEIKKWKECPKCKSIVEKVDGCIHMTCRCKMEFCYVCGGTWSERHWSCQD